MQNFKHRTPEMDIKKTERGIAKLIFDQDLWLFKIEELLNGGGIEVQEFLSSSKAISTFRNLR